MSAASQVPHTPATPVVVEGTSLWKDAWRRLLRNRAAVVGGLITVMMAVMALSFPLLSRYGTRYTHTETHPCLRYLPPGAYGIPRVHHVLDGDTVAQFAAFDTDGDAQLDSLELSAAVRAREFARYDRDGDGRWSVDEWSRVPRTVPGVADDMVFRGLDTNGDGGIDPDEAFDFTDIFPVSEAGFFARGYDTDRSGTLSAQEFRGLPRAQRFLLGSDGLGRDLATRMIFGARVSLAVGFLATFVSFVIGVSWGAFAGYMGGRIDAVMMRIVDIIYGLPFMFLVILLMVVFGREIYLLFIAIGAVSWLTMARIVRGQVISLKNQEYVLAARSIGTSTFSIVFRHLIPNALGPIIVYATLTVPAVMLQEAFLSFLGLGVQAPDTSWGALANEGASPGIMTSYPWLILYPGLALAVTLLSLNFLGDGLRDALDPRVRKN